MNYLLFTVAEKFARVTAGFGRNDTVGWRRASVAVAFIVLRGEARRGTSVAIRLDLWTEIARAGRSSLRPAALDRRSLFTRECRGRSRFRRYTLSYGYEDRAHLATTRFSPIDPRSSE